MLHILEYTEYVKKTRTRKIDKDEFLDILKKHCKNWSPKNDQLWRGNSRIDYDFGHFSAIEKRKKGISFQKWFDELEKDPINYPVIRNKSLIGLCGGTENGMKRATSMLGANVGGNVYNIIPYDNSPMVISPVVDLELLTKLDVPFAKAYNNLPNGLFTKVEYTKNFKVPIPEIRKKYERGKKRMRANTMFSESLEHGFEFFISSPCLLIHEDQMDWLVDIRK